MERRAWIWALVVALCALSAVASATAGMIGLGLTTRFLSAPQRA